MRTKFHVAMFCSDAAYVAKKAFYIKIFGKPKWEGMINEGAEGREYWGIKWDRNDGVLFALLKNQDLTESEEKLAHIEFMFGSILEFNAEIQNRGIDQSRIKNYSQGHKQVFDTDDNGIDWEISYEANIKSR